MLVDELLTLRVNAEEAYTDEDADDPVGDGLFEWASADNAESLR